MKILPLLFTFIIYVFYSLSAFCSGDETVRFDLRRDVRYRGGDFAIDEEGEAIFTVPQAPIKTKSQAAMVYRGRPESLLKERVLRSGMDGRNQVVVTEKWPHCLHGQMSMEFDGREYGGSGVLVGPHHFLTAGHCVYKPETGTLAQNITVRLALNGEVSPFNEALGARVYLYQEWTESQNEDFDIALIVLNRSIGYETGWAGLLCLENDELEDQTVHVTGYPGDKGFKTMWTMDNRLGRIEREQLYYQIDTYGGQSGGAIWIKKWGNPHIVGVHTTGGTSATGNFGVRLSRRKIDTIATQWIAGTLEISDTGRVTTVSGSGGASSDVITPRSLAATGGAVARLLAPAIPDIAKGYEDIYLRFVRGYLVYKPNEDNDRGKIELPIAALPNPLESTFDLSRCGDTGKYLSISTGYRKGRKAENKNKVEVWIVPKFVVQSDLRTTAKHLASIMEDFKSPVGIFRNWGDWSRLSDYDYWVKAGYGASVRADDFWTAVTDRTLATSMGCNRSKLSTIFSSGSSVKSVLCDAPRTPIVGYDSYHLSGGDILPGYSQWHNFSFNFN